MKSTLAQLLLISFAFGASAQNYKDSVFMLISGKPITYAEFETIYKKNNSPNSPDSRNIDEYISMFINFKLKVKEAEELKLDTLPTFVNELNGYRKQLAQPYLTDREVNESLVKEAYERMQSDIKAAHILVKLPADATPTDTLAAYNRIMKIRQRVAKGEDFMKVMVEFPPKPNSDILGESLGYFTAFQMVYPFETIAYGTKQGEISQPVRTRFGYHIIKVFDKRKAKAQIRVAHIMIKHPVDTSAAAQADAKKRIDGFYSSLKNGGNFNDIARDNSDDKSSAVKGGALQWFSVGPEGPVAEFSETAFALKNDGDMSEPVKTNYGWHIIKRLEKKEIASFDELKAEIRNKIQRDGRSNKGRESLIRKIKDDYNYKPDVSKVQEFYKVVDSTFFTGEWKADKAKGLDKVLFTLQDTKYGNNSQSFTQQEFAVFLAENSRRQEITDVKTVVNAVFEKFVEESCIKFEENNLNAKYPEFRHLLQEYRDGILLFDLMDKKVWAKAINDSTGLEAYYEKNKNHFMWGDRVEATIFTCDNNETASKTKELVKKMVKKGYTAADILPKINTDSTKTFLTIKTEKFQKNDDDIIDKIKWDPGITDTMNYKEKIVFVHVHRKLLPEPKTLKEARGLVTAEFQATLESQWIKSLREKFPVEVRREMLSKIKQQ